VTRGRKISPKESRYPELHREPLFTPTPKAAKRVQFDRRDVAAKATSAPAFLESFYRDFNPRTRLPDFVE
jgi:hypothetical protein